MRTRVPINYIAPADAILSMLIQGNEFDKSTLQEQQSGCCSAQ
jgi:hypothetical protein